jgi:hypothetical protein
VAVNAAASFSDGLGDIILTRFFFVAVALGQALPAAL